MNQVCPNCQQSNRAEAKFCAYCRAALSENPIPAIAVSRMPVSTIPASAPVPAQMDSMLCPECGKPVSAKAKFCNYCGQSLTAALAPQSAQQTVPQVVAQSVPQFALQSVPAVAPTTAPQVASNASLLQSPPSYAPPAFTPKIRQGLSRRQKIMVGAAGAIVLMMVVGVTVALLAPPTSSQLSIATATPSVASPAIVAPTQTMMLTVTAQPPTVTPRPTLALRYPAKRQVVVRDGENLFKIAQENCEGILPDQLERYARRIADLNHLLEIDNVRVGAVLDLPDCP